MKYLSLLLTCITAMLVAWFCGSLLWLSYNPNNWDITTKALSIVLTLVYIFWVFILCINIESISESLRNVCNEILLETILILIFYLVISIITFKFNCFDWNLEARNIFVALISILSFLPSTIVSDMFTQKNDNGN